MGDNSVFIKCQEELKKAIVFLEMVCKILNPVKNSLANFEEAMTAYTNGATTFETPLKWAVCVMSTFLRRMDGSEDIRQMIRDLDTTQLSSYKVYMALADKWTTASANSSPICEHIQSAILSLDYYGTRGMPSEAVKGCKAMREAFAPIADAVSLIYLTGRKTFEFYQILKRKDFVPVTFKNPVYNIVVQCLIPAIKKAMDAVFNRGNKFASLNSISKELGAILSYEETLSGIDSSARFRLMDFPDFEEVIESTHDLSTLPPKSRWLGGQLLKTLHFLIRGASQYEQDMMPLRCALFRRLSSQGPNYGDYQAICAILVRLGRRKGSTDGAVAVASRLAKDNKFLSKMCPSVVYLCEIRGSDAELRAESHYTALAVWKTFITCLAILEDNASMKVLMETSHTSTANNSDASNLQIMTNIGDIATSCWADCVFT